MALRIENELITDGRRRSNRIITMRSQGVIPCFAFRKTILPLKDSDADRQDVTWAGLGAISENDEHAYDYEPLGHAMALTVESLGGAFHDSGTFVAPENLSSVALIEPYDITMDAEDRINYCPNWEPQKGDLLCFLFSYHKEYHECVGVLGNSMLASHGKRYILNQRFDLDYLDAFNEENIEDVEKPYE